MDEITKIHSATMVNLPLLINLMSCGTGNPIDDDSSELIGIPDYFIRGLKRPYVVEAVGDSMLPDIKPGDKLIADYHADAVSGDFVIAVHNGDMMVKRLEKLNGYVFLVPNNSEKYKPIPVMPDDDMTIIGVVKWIMHGADQNSISA